MRAGLYPEVPPKRIDYARMNKEHPKLKAALTRAVNSGDPRKVAEAVARAVTVWDEVGAWPDEWNRWRIALEDAWDRFEREEPDDSSLDFDYEAWDRDRTETAAILRRAALPFAF